MRLLLILFCCNVYADTLDGWSYKQKAWENKVQADKPEKEVITSHTHDRKKDFLNSKQPTWKKVRK